VVGKRLNEKESLRGSEKIAENGKRVSRLKDTACRHKAEGINVAWKKEKSPGTDRRERETEYSPPGNRLNFCKGGSRELAMLGVQEYGGDGVSG